MMAGDARGREGRGERGLDDTRPARGEPDAARRHSDAVGEEESLPGNVVPGGSNGSGQTEAVSYPVPDGEGHHFGVLKAREPERGNSIEEAFECVFGAGRR